MAVTLNTNDFGDVATLAILAQVPAAKRVMAENATSAANANIVSGATYLHGVSLADFAVTCGNLTGITMWAPVQGECSLGTLANDIDQTLFLDEVYINSLEFSYTTGANATENYGAETDNKMWLLNSGAFVNHFMATISGTVMNFDFSAIGYDTTSVIPDLSTGNYAFLRKDEDGSPAITLFDVASNEKVNYPMMKGVAANTDAESKTFVFDESDGTLYFPAGPSPAVTVADGDEIEIIYAADKYSDPMNTYFVEKTDGANADVGALRQGQVEIYIIDGDDAAAAWRLTGVTISADLTREPLTELGHLGPYDRPLTLPIPLTVTVDSTAGDLENWARFSGQIVEFEDGTMSDIDLNDLMNKDDLMLMVKVYEQTDEEAGGTGVKRKALTDSVIGEQQFLDGVLQPAYTANDLEYALKTIVVKNLKITDEGMTLDVGANATQTFGFRSTNDLFVVKGDLSANLAAGLTRAV